MCPIFYDSHFKIIEIELDESDNEKEETQIVSKTSLAEILQYESESEKEETKIVSESQNIELETGRNIQSKIDSESYKCDKCNDSFQKLDDLKLHVEEALQELKTYQCTHCEDCFCTKKKFEKHMIEIHSNLHNVSKTSLVEYLLNESESEDEEAQIVSNTPNLDFETRKNATSKICSMRASISHSY